MQETDSKQLHEELNALHGATAEREVTHDHFQWFEEALRKQGKYQDRFREIAMASFSRSDVMDLMQCILGRVTQLLGTKHGYIDVLDYEKDELEIRVASGVFTEYLGLCAKKGEGLAGKAWQTEQVVVLEDYDRWPNRLPSFPYNVIHAAISMPLRFHSHILGVIGIAYSEPEQRFDSEKIQLVDEFSKIISLALSNAFLYMATWSELQERQHTQEELHRYKENLETLVEQRTTALRKSEETSRYNETRFRALIENAHDTVAIIKTDGIILYESPSVERVLGYKANELIGKNVFDFIHPKDVSALSSAFERSIREPGVSHKIELRVRHKDGSWRVLETIGSNLFDDPNLAGIVINSRDITERTQMEQRLRQSETQFRTLAETTNALMCIYQGNRILYANPAAEAITGYTQQELLAIDVLDLIHPDFLRAVKRRILARKTDEYIPRFSELEVKILAKDGREVWLTSTGSVIQLTGKPAILATAFDITKLKEAHEDLRNTWGLVDSIIENIPDMIFLKDAERLQFVRLNKAGEELLGYSRKDLIGKSDRDFFPKKEADFFNERDRMVLQNKRLMDIPEEPIHTRYKGIRYLHTKKVPLLDVLGNPLYLLGISEDITERKQTQEEMNRLAITRQALATQLLRAQEQERQRIARELHDELGQVLTALKMEAEWIVRHSEQSADVKRSANRLCQQLKKTMDQVRSLASRLRPPMLDKLGIGPALRILATEINQHSAVDCSVRIGRNIRKMTSDVETTLYRITQEACTNVVRHARATRLSIALTCNDEFVILSIRDNGRGIPKEKLKSENQAMSLGLAFMHERAALFDGELKIGSRNGKGTVVTAHIPITRVRTRT